MRLRDLLHWHTGRVVLGLLVVLAVAIAGRDLLGLPLWAGPVVWGVVLLAGLAVRVRRWRRWHRSNLDRDAGPLYW